MKSSDGGAKIMGQGFFKALGLVVTLLLMTVLSGPPLSASIVDGVVAVVNNEAILVSEINRALQPVISEYTARYSGNELMEKLNEAQDQLIEKAIEEKLIVQQARKEGMTVDEKMIDARVASIKERFSSEEEFLKALEDQRLSMKEFRKQQEEQLFIKELIRRNITSHIDVLESEERHYFQKNQEKFMEWAKIKVKQIYLPWPENADTNQKEQIHRLADEILLRLEDGAAFEEMATKYSAIPGGEEVSVLSENDILPELKGIFQTGKGQFTPIVESPYGLHIFNILDKKSRSQASFEDVREQIHQLLLEEKGQDLYAKWMDELKEKAYIERKIP